MGGCLKHYSTDLKCFVSGNVVFVSMFLPILESSRKYKSRRFTFVSLPEKATLPLV